MSSISATFYPMAVAPTKTIQLIQLHHSRNLDWVLTYSARIATPCQKFQPCLRYKHNNRIPPRSKSEKSSRPLWKVFQSSRTHPNFRPTHPASKGDKTSSMINLTSWRRSSWITASSTRWNQTIRRLNSRRCRTKLLMKKWPLQLDHLKKTSQVHAPKKRQSLS